MAAPANRVPPLFGIVGGAGGRAEQVQLIISPTIRKVANRDKRVLKVSVYYT